MASASDGRKRALNEFAFGTGRGKGHFCVPIILLGPTSGGSFITLSAPSIGIAAATDDDGCCNGTGYDWDRISKTSCPWEMIL